ncbi:MAG: M17 family peptidase N-terminal domain-containing protein [Pirellulales bacterium]
MLRGLLERKEATGKLFEVTVLHTVPGIAAPLVVVVGLGEAAKCDAGTMFRAAAVAARQVSAQPRKRVAFYLCEGPAVGQEAAVACGAISGSTGGDLYRKEKKRHAPEELLISGENVAAVRAAKRSAKP